MEKDGWTRIEFYKEYNADQILTVNCDPELNQPNVQTPGFVLAACGYVWL